MAIQYFPFHWCVDLITVANEIINDWWPRIGVFNRKYNVFYYVEWKQKGLVSGYRIIVEKRINIFELVIISVIDIDQSCHKEIRNSSLYHTEWCENKVISGISFNVIYYNENWR